MSYRRRYPRRFVHAVNRGLFVRDHLLSKGEDYLENIYREYCREVQRHGYECGTYESFRKFFYFLKALGLVEVVRREPVGDRDIYWRTYYRVKPGMEDHPAWRNPQKHFMETRKH